MAAQIKSPVDRGTTETRLVAGCAYLSRCLRARRSFGVVTTESPEALALLLDRLPAYLQDAVPTSGTDTGADTGDHHLVRLSRPTDSVQEFLVGVLAGLGFEVTGVADEDLRNLLVVFLCHEARHARRTVLLLEQTERFGPRVLDLLQTLAPVKVSGLPAVTIVLTGSPELNRILDSAGMAAANLLARERFDLDRALSWIHNPRPVTGIAAPIAAPLRPAAQPAMTGLAPAGPAVTGLPAAGEIKQPLTCATLIVTFNGTVIDRRILNGESLIVGRSRRVGLRIPSRFVSRLHAEIGRFDGCLRILDLDSTNGTYVNGEKIHAHDLCAGDVVRIGNLRLRFDARVPTDSKTTDDNNR